jgi:hypothetical protein
MPRYLIERVWDSLEEEEMAAKGSQSKHILDDRQEFSAVTWHHSHMVMDEDGQLKSFCVYTAPNTAVLWDHSALLGDHKIQSIYEIGGDISPDDFD